VPTTADRVRDLIRDSGMTQHDFAVAVGLDDSKLSKSLGGIRRFSSLDLARIAELGRVSVDWLITGDEPPVAVAARTTGGSAKAALREAKRFTTMRSDLASLGFRQPWNPVPAQHGGRAVDEGQMLAASAAERIDPATCTDLATAVEQVFGVDVAIVPLGSDFDGLAASSEDAKLIVVGTSQVPGRQRFTLAHELGHLLAGDDHGVHLDRDVFEKAQRRDLTEMRANAFASAFLMPEGRLRESLRGSVPSEHAFAALACDLLVSPSTLAYRLLNLRLIDSGTCSRLAALSGAAAARIAGRSDEWVRRVSAASTARPPGLLTQDAYRAYEAGATTLRPYANLLGIDVDALRDALEAEAGAVGPP